MARCVERPQRMARAPGQRRVDRCARPPEAATPRSETYSPGTVRPCPRSCSARCCDTSARPRPSLWVETDSACEVEILGTQRAHLLRVRPPLRARLLRRPRARHLARVRGARSTASASGRAPTAAPAERVPHLPEGRAAADRLRLLPRRGPARAAVLAARKDEDERGREIDALHTLALPHARRAARALARRAADARRPGLRRRGLAGDARVHRDAPRPVRAARRARCSTSRSTRTLYRESWSDPAIRWLLSTVSTTMIFDDHDVHDDWNISEAWVEEMREHHWWDEHIEGALVVVLGLPAPRQPLARRARGRRAARAGEGGRRRRAAARGVRAPRRPRRPTARAGASAATSAARA